MEIKAIKNYLPHRYPFLLVDKVLEIQKFKSIKGLKNVTVNEPFFMGHFPVEPVMPGVLIIEALAQAAGILIVSSLSDTESLVAEKGDNIYFLVGIDNAKFKRVVLPGDQLHLEVQVNKYRLKRKYWKFLASAYVADKLACTAELITMKDQSYD